MTNLELFCALSHIRAENLSDAEALQGDVPFPRPKTRKRFFLIAALIALTLLLVGCAVVYVLRLQDLKVGEYRFYVPAAYDENGEVIPVETREPFTVLSVQGSNMEALAEWVAFTNAYDLDGTIALEADLAAKSGTPWDIPEDHARTYGCYSQEMVNKLDEIAEKYHLKLLSGDIPFNEYENSILFRSLGLDSLVQDAPMFKWNTGTAIFIWKEPSVCICGSPGILESGNGKTAASIFTIPERTILTPPPAPCRNPKAIRSGTTPGRTGKQFYWCWEQRMPASMQICPMPSSPSTSPPRFWKTEQKFP